MSRRRRNIEYITAHTEKALVRVLDFESRRPTDRPALTLDIRMHLRAALHLLEQLAEPSEQK